MSFKNYVCHMPTKDIERHLNKLKKELASDYDGWSGIVDQKRDSLRETIKVYEEEMINRILLEQI